MADGISVVICMYNGARRIRATLTALAACVADGPMELVIVDNGSSDGGREIARDCWNEIGAPFPLRLVLEDRPGVAIARRTGVAAATHSLIVFCDDDNWLDSRYLKIAREIMSAHPEVGVLGGRSVPHYESEPPSWFCDLRAFAIGVQAEAEGDVTETQNWVWGAGSVVRGAALQQLAAAQVVPVTVTRGEDIELCMYLRKLGWRIWYSPLLVFTHQMPKSRFDWRSYRSLKFQNGVVNATVQIPWTSNRSRLWAASTVFRAWWHQVSVVGKRDGLTLATAYLFGQIYGLAFGGREIAIVRENRNKLAAACAVKSTAATSNPIFAMTSIESAP